MKPLSAEEAWARDCIHEALPWCAVGQHDDSSEPAHQTWPPRRLGVGTLTVSSLDPPKYPIPVSQTRSDPEKAWSEIAALRLGPRSCLVSKN